MKATEAKRITEQNQLSLTDALKQIEGAANSGRSAYVFDNLHLDTFTRLIELGYKVSKFTDPMGWDFTKIEW